MSTKIKKGDVISCAVCWAFGYACRGFVIEPNNNSYYAGHCLVRVRLPIKEHWTDCQVDSKNLKILE